MRHILVSTIIALVLGACTALPAPASPTAAATAFPTLAILPTGTSTSTPAPAPSPTSAASPVAQGTLLPTQTLAPTPTVYVFTLPSMTASPPPSAAWNCSLIGQTSTKDVTYKPGERFSISWIFVNTGSASWFPGNVMFVYTGGTHMALNTQLQIPREVAPGQSIGFSIEMKAPKTLSEYTTFFALRQGKTFFCPVKVNVAVSDQ